MMMNFRMRNPSFYVDLNGVVVDALEDHNAHIEYFLGKWTDDEKKVSPFFCGEFSDRLFLIIVFSLYA